MKKTALTLFLFTFLATIPYFIPGLEQWRVLVPSPIAKKLHLKGAPGSDTTSGDQEDHLPPVKIPKISGQAELTPGEIEDPSGQAMDAFFSALFKSETEGGIVRVCHYGDSPITSDGITATVRRKLQLKFGDAGHGFIFISRPWGWYGHSNVYFDPGRGWDSDPMWIGGGDHIYGLGGATFRSRSAGSVASFGTVTDGETGHQVSTFNIYYLAQSHGGEFAVEVDGTQLSKVSTASDQTQSAVHKVEVAPGPHRMTLRTLGNGEVRLFGVVLENTARGVSYDSLGVNGAFTGLLVNYQNFDHWKQQLQLRKPDLVVLAYGTNESEFERLPMDQYEKDCKEAVRRIREALPECSIMFVSPMDRGKRGPGGEIITRPMIPKLVRYQRRIAAETGCAFFDTFTAMGGEGTVARWREMDPKLMGGDFTHPTAQGSEIVGSLIYDALMRAYDKFRIRQLALKSLTATANPSTVTTTPVVSRPKTGLR